MKVGWRDVLGVLLSVLLLWWVLRRVELAEVWHHLRTANLALLMLTAVLGTLIFPLRARRWRPILDPIAPNMPFGPLWRATAIGMMANNVLPARVGELARAFSVSRETGRVTFSAAFASIAVDRVFDAFIVLVLLAIAMFDPAFPSDRLVGGRPIANWMGFGTIILASFVAVLYAVVFFPARIITIFEFFARRLAPRFEEQGKRTLSSFMSGLSVLRSPGRFASVIAWTVAHWLLNALAFWVAFRAVGIDAPFSAALVLQGIIAMGVSVPSSPGFWGVFEALAVLTLPLYGVSVSQATSWAIGFHLLTFIPITVIGLFYFFRLGFHFRDLKRAPERAE
jgi:glycosyltransferase 2 family protein